MTASAWAALAAGLLLLTGPADARSRLADLAAAGRVGRDARRARHRETVTGAHAPARTTVVRRAAGGPFSRLVPAGCACAAATGGWLLYGPALALAAAAIAVTGGQLAADLRTRRREAQAAALLSAAVDALVAELDAGSRPGAALAAAADVAPPHAVVLQQAARAADAGRDAGAVLRDDAHTARLGVAWDLGQHIGASPAPVLQRVGDDLRAAAEQRRAVGVALSGPRASAVVLAGLPVVGIAMGTAMGARPTAFLTATPPGQAVCLLGVLLDVVGVWWVRRIVRRAERAP